MKFTYCLDCKVCGDADDHIGHLTEEKRMEISQAARGAMCVS